jgi:CheY-like chemotaxis protein
MMEAPMRAHGSMHAVLVVEDEPILRLDIAETFLAAGFRAFEAGSAEEEIDILERHPEIRAVFTDIEMPGTMDGIQLAHVIRKRWPPTILVVSSGHSFPASYALPSKATFLAKPYSDGALANAVQSISGQLSDSAQAN